MDSKIHGARQALRGTRLAIGLFVVHDKGSGRFANTGENDRSLSPFACAFFFPDGICRLTRHLASSLRNSEGETNHWQSNRPRISGVLPRLTRSLCQSRGRNVSRAMGSPFRKMVSIESYAETFARGFSRNSSKSARLPTSTVPRSFARPNVSALSSVAARRIRAGGTPASTQRVISKRPLRPGGFPIPSPEGVSLPHKSFTFSFHIRRSVAVVRAGKIVIAVAKSSEAGGWRLANASRYWSASACADAFASSVFR